MFKVCDFQFNLSSKVKPRNREDETLVRGVPSIRISPGNVIIVNVTYIATLN